jgi:hypothetical protein
LIFRFALATVSHWCYKKSIPATIDKGRVAKEIQLQPHVEGVGNDVDAYGPVP